MQKFTRDGRFLLKWGEEGSGPGQLNLPWGIALDPHGDVFVADWRNDRIQKYSPEGRYLATVGGPGRDEGGLNRPSGVAVDADGYVYIADWGNERVQVFNPDGEFVLKLRGQATLSKWSKEFFASNPDEVRTRDMANLLPDLPDHLPRPAERVRPRPTPYFVGGP